MLDPFIGDLLLSRVYMETLRPFIEKRNKDGGEDEDHQFVT